MNTKSYRRKPKQTTSVKSIGKKYGSHASPDEIDSRTHAELSVAFKCMAEMINRVMYLLISIVILCAFGYYVISYFPFGKRKDRLLNALDTLECGIE